MDKSVIEHISKRVLELEKEYNVGKKTLSRELLVEIVDILGSRKISEMKSAEIKEILKKAFENVVGRIRRNEL